MSTPMHLTSILSLEEIDKKKFDQYRLKGYNDAEFARDEIERKNNISLLYDNTAKSILEINLVISLQSLFLKISLSISGIILLNQEEALDCKEALASFSLAKSSFPFTNISSLAARPNWVEDKSFNNSSEVLCTLATLVFNASTLALLLSNLVVATSKATL
ncbi:hypothetical protein CR513_04983, partial [Mucuna pruriens]